MSERGRHFSDMTTTMDIAVGPNSNSSYVGSVDMLAIDAMLDQGWRARI